LTNAENWLYDEGFDETKQVYDEKLTHLRATGDTFEFRYTEQQERPRACRALKASIDEYLEVVNSTDEKYAHLDDSERDTVRQACEKAQSWLDDHQAQQERQPLAADPVFTSAMVNDHNQDLASKCRPIVTKKKPIPPKEESKDKDGDEKMKETDGENGDEEAANGGEDDAEKSKENEGKEDGKAEEMDLD